MATSSESALLNELHGRPYYAVRVRPDAAAELDLDGLKKTIQENRVSLRGWDFPHYDERSAHFAGGYLFNVTNWSGHVELWRLYRSGQFVYFGSPWDVAMDFQMQLRKEFDAFVLASHPSQKDTVRGILSFIGIIYSVTEFHVFAARLARHLAVDDGFLDVSLRNIEGWALASGQAGLLWHGFYQCHANDVRLIAHLGDVVDNPVSTAASMLRELFEYFNWDRADVAIASWQERFMAGKFVF